MQMATGTCTSQWPLRIAMLSIHSSPLGALGSRDTGGMSVYVREVSRWLGAAGHGVDIFTCAGAPQSPQDLSPNVRLIHIGSGQLAGMSKTRLPGHVPQVITALEAFRQKNRLNYDLIHSHYWISGLVGSLAQAHWQRPHLVMFHTLGAAKNAPGSGENESALRVAEERRLALEADRVLAPTNAERINLMTHYGIPREKISVVPCGVDLDLFQPRNRIASRQRLNIPDEEETILFVGRFVPLKGLENLMRAVAQLRPQRPRLALRVIGGDEEQGSPALIRLAAQLGMSQAVFFTGPVAQSDLPFYYNAADLLALPSYYESFALVVLEALACGTPVAATAVGVVPDVIRDGVNGAILAGPRPDEIAQGLTRWLAAPRDPERARNIRRSVETYGWQSVAAAMEAVFQAIQAGRNAR